jgi:hypothetical protein
VSAQDWAGDLGLLAVLLIGFAGCWVLALVALLRRRARIMLRLLQLPQLPVVRVTTRVTPGS